MSRHDPGPAFRALHQSGNPFILANAWDRGSAKMLAALGAQALATSSGAHAFTLGHPDMGTLSRDEALSHAADLVSATSLPVSGDFENGFGEAPEICAETVRLACEAGLERICRETNAPINALAAGPYTSKSRAEFASIGIARISLGAALARLTHRAIHDTGKAMFEGGDFSTLGNALPASVTDPLLLSIPDADLD